MVPPWFCHRRDFSLEEAARIFNAAEQKHDDMLGAEEIQAIAENLSKNPVEFSQISEWRAEIKEQKVSFHSSKSLFTL
eukprot:SAG22_NODE_1959_length_3249_cov_2.004762_4_plen_78_part_00